MKVTSAKIHNIYICQEIMASRRLCSCDFCKTQPIVHETKFKTLKDAHNLMVESCFGVFSLFFDETK